jgi:hypothetical protein
LSAKQFVGLFAVVAALVAFTAPSQAEAGVSNFCENQKISGLGAPFPEDVCIGAARTVYAVGGWGDQHSMCVGIGWNGPGFWGAKTCSGGPGQWTYNALGTSVYGYPKIENNAAGWNVVHGRAYQP